MENHDRSDNLACRVLDRRGAVFHRNLAAILPNENGEVGEVLRRSVLERGGNRISGRLASLAVDQVQNLGDRAPDGGVGLPAAQLFRYRIEEGDVAIVIHRDDGVADAAKGDAEPLALFAQFRLGRDPLGDVAETPDPPDVAVTDPLDFGNALDDAAVAQVQKVVRFRRPLLVNFVQARPKSDWIGNLWT